MPHEVKDFIAKCTWAPEERRTDSTIAQFLRSSRASQTKTGVCGSDSDSSDARRFIINSAWVVCHLDSRPENSNNGFPYVIHNNKSLGEINVQKDTHVKRNV